MNFIEIISNYLRCVDCAGKLFMNSDNSFKCKKCGRIYYFEKGIIKMLPTRLLLNKDKESIDKFSEIKTRDSQAGNYDKKRPYFYTNLLEKLTLKYLGVDIENKSKKLLLDLGCGTGRFECLLHNKYKMIFAVDFSIESLKMIAKRNYDNVLLIQADANQLPFMEKLFDDVCMVDFFQHIPSFCLREKLLLNIKNISKKGARIILTSYNYNERKAKQRLIYEKSENVFGEWGKTGYHANSIYYYNYHYSELIPLVNQFFDIQTYFGFYLDFPLYLRIIRKLLNLFGISFAEFESKYYFTKKDLKYGNRLFVYGINKH